MDAESLFRDPLAPASGERGRGEGAEAPAPSPPAPLPRVQGRGENGEPIADYPAAHSMDTFWFGVDKDGHVAFFNTGEAGAMPRAADVEEREGVLGRLERLVAPGEVVYDLQGRIGPPTLDKLNRHCTWATDRLVFLSSLGQVRKEMAAGRAWEVPATSGVAAVITGMTDELSRRLHDSGACLGCFYHWAPTPELLASLPGEARGPGVGPEQLGLFTYGHLCENWDAGPYGRWTVPRRPLHLDELPPDLRDVVGRMRFPDLCFAETPHIAPFEWTACHHWGEEERDYEDEEEGPGSEDIPY